MEDINNKAIDFEVKISDMSEKSNQRAWRITFLSIFITIVVIIFYIYKPLIQTVPYVIKVNEQGIASLLTSITEKDIEVGEAVDKYFIKEYITKKEGYYWHFIEDDYVFVQLLSSPKISEEYKKIYSGVDGRDKKLGKDTEVIINIEYITLKTNAKAKTATVKIEKSVKSKNKPVSKTHQIITLSYFYNNKLILSERNRLKSPLGFTVTAYRIDMEIEK